MRFILFLIPMFLITTAAHAYKVQFSWKKNPEPLTGYIFKFTTNPSKSIPFDCAGLNNGECIPVSKQLTHKPDTEVFVNASEERAYFEMEELNPSKGYHIALTAYVDESCEVLAERYNEPLTLTTQYYVDGSPYCESGYSRIVTLPVQPVPGILTIYINAKGMNLKELSK